MIPAQVFTSTEKFQRINGMSSSTWFLIWENERLQSFHCVLRSFVFRWVTLDPIRIEVLHPNCVTMLPNEIRSLQWSRPAPEEFLHGARVVSRELTNFTIRIFWENVQVRCACQLACFVFGLLDLFAKTRRSVNSSSELTPHIITCFSGLAHLLVAAPRQCVSRVRSSPERSSLKG